MSYCLPVLQYETDPPPDDAGAPASPAPANNEQYAAPARSQERGQHQQPGPSSKHRSSKPGAAVKGASSKPSKKEQQQAQERPDVGLRPDVMQKLSKERRKRAFIGMLRLLEHGAKDSSELQMLVAPMSDEELLQVAQERSLAGRCGNPLCKQPFEPERASSKYSLSAGELHPVEAIEGDCYCSKSCSSFTQQLAAQLVNPMDRIKPSALHKALEAPSHKPQKPQQQGVGAQGGGVTTMKSVIEERPAYQLIHAAESAGKRLDEAAAAVGGDSTAAAAVEGYIPRQAPDTQPKRQAQAGPQQQQKQKQGSSAAGDEATAEVLQLNPVLNEHPGGQQAAAAAAAGTVDAAATAATTAAAGGGGGSKAAAADVDAAAAGGGGGLLGSSDELQQYLQVFREHQEKKLQQINQRQPADTNGTADKQQGHTVKPQQQQQQQQQQQMHQQQQGELPQPEGSQKQRKVRFAPDIEYSCPADPVQHHQEQEQQQPVLTFTMLDGDSSSRRGRSGTAGGSSGDMVGELHLTTVDELEPDLQAAAAGEGAAGDSGNGQQQQQQQQELSEAWKLFLPPALGGIGVPVKQVIVEGPENGSAAKPQQRQQRGRQLQQQQQQGSTLQQRQQQEKQACPAAGAAAAAPAPSSKSSKGAVSVAVALATAARPAEPAAKRNAAAAPAAAAAGGAGAGAGSAAPASKLRKFSPLVKPRRSVVMLDEVPGVTLQQRGVRPSAAAATAAASAAAAAAAGPAAASQAAAPSVQPATASNGSSSTASASTSTNGVNSSSSSSGGGGINSSSSKGRNQVVHIGPLRHTPSLNSSSSSRPDQQQSPGDDNGSGSDNSSGGGSDSDDGAMSDVSSQEEWYPELNTGNSSSRNSTRPQRNSSNSTNGNRNPAATAVAREDGGDPWDSGSESGGDAGGGSEAGDSLQEGEGSDGSGYGLEDMMSSAAGALDSLLPFFDTRGITVSLSEFGLVWNHLHSWVSPATVAYVGDRGAREGGSTSGGTSYGVSGISSSIGTAAVSPPAAAAAPAAADGGGAGVTAAAASEQQGSTSAAVTQQRTALVNLLSAALPPVVQQLNISVPEAQISKQLSALVRSFYLPPGPLPALQPRQWQLLVTLMLAAVAAWRLPVLRPVFKRQQQCEGSGSALGVWVQQLGTDLDRFWALMDLFELRV